MTEWLEKSKNSAYPFISSLAENVVLSSVLLDAVVTYRDPTNLYPDSTSVIKLISVDLKNGTVTLTISGTSVSWGSASLTTGTSGDFTIYQWVSTTGTVKFVAQTSRILTVAWPMTFTSANRPTFVPSACYQLPEMVTGVRVKYSGGTYSSTLPVADTQIIIDEGNNCQTTATVGVTDTTIKLDFVPGAGEGRVSCTEDTTPVLRTINGVGPDELGNFNVTGDDCISVYQPESTANELAIRSDCAACCQCSDYATSYNYINNLISGTGTSTAGSCKAIRDTLYSASGKMGNAINRIANKKTQVEKATIKCVATPDNNWQLGCRVTIANSTKLTIPAGTQVKINYSFTKSEKLAAIKSQNNWTLPPDAVTIQDPTASSGSFTMTLPAAIKPASWAVYNLSGLVEGLAGASGRADGNPVTLTATMTLPSTFSQVQSTSLSDECTVNYRGEVQRSDTSGKVTA